MNPDFSRVPPDDVPEKLQEATSSVAKAFMQSALTDPLFEFGLLVVTFMPPDSDWRDGEPWGARHWIGQQGKVRSDSVPRKLPLKAFAEARPANAEWNAAWWLAGLKPDASGAVMRILVEPVEDPLVPLEDGNWAVSRISQFHADLASRA